MSPASPEIRLRFVFISAVILWLLATPASAWHEAGHRFTAEIAFGLLNDEQQRRVAAILRAHPRFREDFANFMPDDIANGTEADKIRWMMENVEPLRSPTRQ